MAADMGGKAGQHLAVRGREFGPVVKAKGEDRAHPGQQGQGPVLIRADAGPDGIDRVFGGAAACDGGEQVHGLVPQMHRKLFVQKARDGQAGLAVECRARGKAVDFGADLAFAQTVLADAVERPGKQPRIGR
jgi:hypothetical protein